MKHESNVQILHKQKKLLHKLALTADGAFYNRRQGFS